jgi:2-polyprenyl-3-methyl-5-hydroxy-6-metoxy-1,4-benzoquinol methylase
VKEEEPPQNIYDDPDFFEGYRQLHRFNAGFGNAIEHAPFLDLIGSVEGRTVLDLGCGGGQLAHYLAEAGAVHVTAIDASQRMLEFANEHWSHARVTYIRASMEEAAFPATAFDLVVSSLAFHYVEDFGGLIGRIVSWLGPSGRLVFSTEHPIYAARATDSGWTEDEQGNKAWAIADYALEGLRERHWFVPGVRRYHRTMAAIFNMVIDAGMTIDRIYESHPSPEWLREHPEHAEELQRPMFLLVAARKPGD